MINLVLPLPIGNAARILIAPPTGATEWRLLRKLADDFTGATDPDAAVIYDGAANTSILDTQSLTNGVPYYYRDYALVSGAWVAGPTVSGTPAASGQDGGPDVLSIVRDRLELWLRATVGAGRLVNKDGYIRCLIAPPQYDRLRFPVVSVHLQSAAPDVRAVGELVAPDSFDAGSNLWDSSEGWLERVQLLIIGWSLNPDERITLRKEIRSAIQGNLSIFDDAGMVQIQISQSDLDDMESYEAPVYQVHTSFSCLAPSLFTGTEIPVTDVTLTATALQP